MSPEHRHFLARFEGQRTQRAGGELGFLQDKPPDRFLLRRLLSLQILLPCPRGWEGGLPRAFVPPGLPCRRLPPASRCGREISLTVRNPTKSSRMTGIPNRLSTSSMITGSRLERMARSVPNVHVRLDLVPFIPGGIHDDPDHLLHVIHRLLRGLPGLLRKGLSDGFQPGPGGRGFRFYRRGLRGSRGGAGWAPRIRSRVSGAKLGVPFPADRLHDLWLDDIAEGLENKGIDLPLHNSGQPVFGRG